MWPIKATSLRRRRGCQHTNEKCGSNCQLYMAMASLAATTTAVPRTLTRHATQTRRRTLLSVGVGVLAVAGGARLAGVGLRDSGPLSRHAHTISRALVPAPGCFSATLAGVRRYFSFDFVQPASKHHATMSKLTPPQPPPKWTHSAADIRDITAAAIAQNRALQDKIAALKPEECTLETVRRRVGRVYSRY